MWKKKPFTCSVSSPPQGPTMPGLHLRMMIDYSCPWVGSPSACVMPPWSKRWSSTSDVLYPSWKEKLISIRNSAFQNKPVLLYFFPLTEVSNFMETQNEIFSRMCKLHFCIKMRTVTINRWTPKSTDNVTLYCNSEKLFTHLYIHNKSFCFLFRITVQ